jgi:hypothetical protein
MQRVNGHFSSMEIASRSGATDAQASTFPPGAQTTWRFATAATPPHCSADLRVCRVADFQIGSPQPAQARRSNFNAQQPRARHGTFDAERLQQFIARNRPAENAPRPAARPTLNSDDYFSPVMPIKNHL